MSVTRESRQPRYWEDVTEGDEIPGFELYLSETKMVEQVSGSQDFYPVHHDREFARAGGHEDVFFNTGFTRAALGRLLGDYVGTEGWTRRLEYSMRRMNRPGDTIRARGKVTRKYLEDDGTGLLDLDVWLENSREGTTTPGKATVMLPQR